jgi:hypothetical protein
MESGICGIEESAYGKSATWFWPLEASAFTRNPKWRLPSLIKPLYPCRSED